MQQAFTWGTQNSHFPLMLNSPLWKNNKCTYITCRELHSRLVDHGRNLRLLQTSSTAFCPYVSTGCQFESFRACKWTLGWSSAPLQFIKTYKPPAKMAGRACSFLFHRNKWHSCEGGALQSHAAFKCDSRCRRVHRGEGSGSGNQVKRNMLDTYYILTTATGVTCTMFLMANLSFN